MDKFVLIISIYYKGLKNEFKLYLNYTKQLNILRTLKLK